MSRGASIPAAHEAVAEFAHDGIVAHQGFPAGRIQKVAGGGAVRGGDELRLHQRVEDGPCLPLDVLPGDTVEWTNSSTRRHTVTAGDDSFDSGDLFGGDAFAHAFDNAGTYAYHCSYHPMMHGELIVQ